MSETLTASAASDGKIILWNLNLDNLLTEACQQVYDDSLQTNPNVSNSDRRFISFWRSKRK